MNFGVIIKELTRDNGIPQSKLAKELGITRSRLNNYISKRSEPDFEMLKNIARYFDVSIDYLLGRTPKSMPKTNNFAPEIVPGELMPESSGENVQWVPIYLSVASYSARSEGQPALPLGWLKTNKHGIKNIGFRMHYALLINDDSMFPELHPGDIAYVQPSFFLHSIIPSQNLYSIRLYHTDNVGLAIKRCYVFKNILMCIAENARYEPIIFRMEKTIFEPIFGHISGVWRSVNSANILNTLI